MIRKPATIAFWRGRLPHWEVEEGRYFVTLHLAGAIPEAGYARIHALAAEYDRLQQRQAEAWIKTQRRMFKEMEAWLDRGEHVTHFRDPRLAEMVQEAVAHREARHTWRVFEFVVMPNHLHLFFEVLQGHLKEVLEDFKRWTGHRAGQLLDLRGKSFWQDEWFDHWSRSDAEDERIIAYIRQNPVQAGLVRHLDEWPHASWFCRSRLPGGTGVARP